MLPPELAAEAQNLRRDWEARNRQLMQERFLNQLQTNTALSSILRHSGRGRIGARYAIHAVPQRCNWSSWNRSEGNNSASPVINGGMRMRGRQLLDHESLSCLLVLLFADEPKLNTLRLHRVIRNLCYHGPTREWIVKALLSIIDRSVNIKNDVELLVSKPSKKVYRPGPLSVKLTTDPKAHNNSAAWLNIKMDAALGCRANVFIVHRNHSGKRNEKQSANSVNVHPQAAPVVCRHALDLFISLAKNFPSFFLSVKKAKEDEQIDTKKSLSPIKSNKIHEPSDFWDMLLKLDSLSATKKGKSVAKTHTYSVISADNDTNAFTFETSTFGQLLNMLSSKVITRSPQLTDKLLRLLSLITIGLHEFPGFLTASINKSKNSKSDNVSSVEESLQLVVNVITSKNCSEEGLEDAAALLYNVANCSEEMRHMILFIMLNGALKLSIEISNQINNLLSELQTINQQEVANSYILEAREGTSTEKPSKGLICDRFTKEAVVITAASKVKQTCDLQLPSMAPLTTKTSSQAFFLRLLRLIAQMHEILKKNSKIGKYFQLLNNYGLSSIVINVLEFDVPDDAPTDVEENDTPMETSSSVSPAKNLTLPPGVDFGKCNGCFTITLLFSYYSYFNNIFYLFVDTDIDKELPNLSEMMSLGKLWQTLSQCLLELEHTPDHHAVLVLQVCFILYLHK